MEKTCRGPLGGRGSSGGAGGPAGRGEAPSAVVDTNVFVGAGFRPHSGAGRVIQAVREGRLRMPWSAATRGEIEAVVARIPPLSIPDLEALFREEDRVEGEPDEGGLEWVGEAGDRKFAAVARAAGAFLVSNDDHLLARRHEAPVRVLRSGEFAEAMGWGSGRR